MKKQMKWVLTPAIVLLMLVSLVLPVFADMGAPWIEEYEVVVNPGGTVTKDGTEIPEGTVLTITFEYKENDGTIWGDTRYNGKSEQVNLSDATNGNTIPETAGSKQDKEQSYIVVWNDGVDVYAGPGYGYKKLFNVPNGKKISGWYQSGDWTYIRYGKEEGWVFSYAMTDSCGLALYAEKNNPINIWVLTDTAIYDSTAYDTAMIGTIPADTVIQSEIYSLRRDMFYVDYKGCKGWINSGETLDAASDMSPCEYKAESDGTAYLFKKPVETAEELTEPLGTIDVKKDDVFDIYYSNYYRGADFTSWSYIEKDGVAGWTPTSFADFTDDNKAGEEYVLEFLKYIGEIERGKDHKVNYPEEVVVYPLKKADEDKDTDTEYENSKTKKSRNKKKKDEADEESALGGLFENPTFVIVFCLVCAVIFVVGSVVLLIVIKNKKKKTE